MHTDSSTFEQLRTILAEVTGNEAADICPESILVDDLGMTDAADLPRIIKRINREFDIRLDLNQVAAETETVEDLLMLIIDETELG